MANAMQSTQQSTRSYYAPPKSMAGEATPWPIDTWLLGVVVALCLIGMVFVASASTSIATEYTGNALHYAKRHAVFLCIAIAAASAVFAVPMQWWDRGRFVMLGAGFVALVAVLLIGKEVNSAVRWISVGPVNVQASEVARVCFILYMAGYLAHRGAMVRTDLSAFVRPAILFVAAAVLLMRQPDFGATVVLGVTMMGMLFLAGARILPFLVTVLVASGSFALLIIYSPYRVRRLLGFVDPWEDPYGASYQLVQSLIAVGRGEWFGVGLGQGLQKQGFMPESHTDFIYAVIAEEFGLLGTLGVLSLYVVLVWRVFKIATAAIDAGREFMAYLCAGIGLWLGTQAFVNMGVNMGLLPTKGLTLPLISYGGSSLVVTLCAIALLLRASYELKRQPLASQPKNSTRKPKAKQRRGAK